MKTALTALVVTCAAALSIGTPAHAATGMEMAIQDDVVMLSQGYYGRDQALERATELGVTRLRVNLQWARVLGDQATSPTVPRPPVYDWSDYDALIDAAAARGIRVQLALVGGPTPTFATPDATKKNYRPNAKRFGEFARAAALHFAGRVDRYSVWNEPNWTSWLGPQKEAPKLYRALYTAGYKAIKSADRNAQVMFGETQPHTGSNKRKSIAPLKFLRQVLCLDAKYKPIRRQRCPRLVADAYAHHPYEFTQAPNTKWKGADNVTIGTLGRLTTALTKVARAKVLRTKKGRALDVYLTEFGYFASGSRALPDSRRAEWLRQGYDIAAANPRVRQNVHYLLVQPPLDHPSRLFNTGLLSPDGATTPAYDALLSWTQTARANGKIRMPGGPIFLPPAR